jgi:hypothetical protein
MNKEIAHGIPLAERGAGLRAEVLGPAHPDVARDLNALGALYQFAGRRLKPPSRHRVSTRP